MNKKFLLPTYLYNLIYAGVIFPSLFLTFIPALSFGLYPQFLSDSLIFQVVWLIVFYSLWQIVGINNFLSEKISIRVTRGALVTLSFLVIIIGYNLYLFGGEIESVDTSKVQNCKFEEVYFGQIEGQWAIGFGGEKFVPSRVPGYILNIERSDQAKEEFENCTLN